MSEPNALYVVDVYGVKITCFSLESALPFATAEMKRTNKPVHILRSILIIEPGPGPCPFDVKQSPVITR